MSKQKKLTELLHFQRRRLSKKMRIYAVNCDKGRAERLYAAASSLHLDMVLVASPLADSEEVVRRGKACFERGTSYPTGCAATIGHLRALEQFVADGDPLGIIIEDDVRFHRDFMRIVDAMVPHMMSGETDVLSLGYVNIPLGERIWVGTELIIKNVGVSNPWGAQCYMVTRAYAAFLVNMFREDDLSLPYTNHFVTDWVLFDPANGCRRDTLIFPIAIESPDEQTIAGSTNKPNIVEQCALNTDDFRL
jgi:GR25 family glycosyltransferase involved in LPS biosynthesis